MPPVRFGRRVDEKGAAPVRVMAREVREVGKEERSYFGPEDLLAEFREDEYGREP